MNGNRSNHELDKAVVGLIAIGNSRAGDIQAIVRKIPVVQMEQEPKVDWMRAVDKSLQRQKRRGKILFTRELGWQTIVTP